MNFSKPSLHARVVTELPHQILVESALKAARAKLAAKPLRIGPPAASYEIPLTTVSLNSNFDAYINIRFRGEPGGESTSLLVDSGNASLIVPDYRTIASLPNFSQDYTILADAVQEPWGCPAKLLRGPIEIPTTSGGVYEIQGCVFLACTDANQDAERTANFGTGWISPWRTFGSLAVQSPLSYASSHPFAEFDYSPAATVTASGTQPSTADSSYLRLYQAIPSGYAMFDIIRNCAWMSLIPRSLAIGATNTRWPGSAPSPIAMVDTGGGPVFLSDPNGYLYPEHWPEEVPSPCWTSSSDSCRSVKDDLTIVLGDQTNSFSYVINTADIPASVQGLTLVMCRNCYYMMGNQGMNIGGLSALFNYILIDNSSGRVGFRSIHAGAS